MDKNAVVTPTPVNVDETLAATDDVAKADKLPHIKPKQVHVQDPTSGPRVALVYKMTTISLRGMLGVIIVKFVCAYFMAPQIIKTLNAKELQEYEIQVTIASWGKYLSVGFTWILTCIMEPILAVLDVGKHLKGKMHRYQEKKRSFTNAIVVKAMCLPLVGLIIQQQETKVHPLIGDNDLGNYVSLLANVSEQSDVTIGNGVLSGLQLSTQCFVALYCLYKNLAPGRPLLTRYTTGARVDYEILRPKNFLTSNWADTLKRTECSGKMNVQSSTPSSTEFTWSTHFK